MLGFLTDLALASAPEASSECQLGRGAAISNSCWCFHPTTAVDLKQSWTNHGRPTSGGESSEDLVVQSPASPRRSKQHDEKFKQSHSFHVSHEWCCCWRGGTFGWDIFITSSFPSLSIQNKLQLVRGGKDGSQWEKDSLAHITTGYVDTCHCGGTAASILASQLPVTFPD